MKKLAVIGTGVMGSAIIEALIREEVFSPGHIIGCDADGKKLGALRRKLGIQTEKSIHDATDSADLILLAVKPQSVKLVCHNWRGDKPIISILAGVPIDTIKKLTGSKKIIRVMPNTPAQVSAGVSGWKASAAVTAADKALVRRILGSFSEETEVKNEKLLDIITAVSGSGPAYFFAFAEALERAARKIGLGNLSPAFVGQTFFGAAKLADVTEVEFKKLRENVTSKGGTTEAALKALKKGKLNATVEEAVKAALKRSQELAEKQD